MRLAISNIAWDVAEDALVASLLNKYDIDAIDIAPGKYFPEPVNANDQDIKALKDWWEAKGIEITGMQALLFGTSGLNVFGSMDSQRLMLEHLGAVCRIGSVLGAKRIVFGSPKNRDRSGLSDEETMQVAVRFFRQLGDLAHKHGVIICLEPNPTDYGANFMTTSAETAEVVRQISHPAIKMQLDTGAITMNHESIDEVLKNAADLIGHVHASEPDLIPLGDGSTDHIKMAAALLKNLPQHLVTIEMVATKNEPHMISIERAVNLAIQSYQPTCMEINI